MFVFTEDGEKKRKIALILSSFVCFTLEETMKKKEEIYTTDVSLSLSLFFLPPNFCPEGRLRSNLKYFLTLSLSLSVPSSISFSCLFVISSSLILLFIFSSCFFLHSLPKKNKQALRKTRKRDTHTHNIARAFELEWNWLR